MSAYRSDWWAGLTVDHLFADCPNRTRAEASLRACRWWDIAGWGIDPLGSDVCGLCRHRWLRAHPEGGGRMTDTLFERHPRAGDVVALVVLTAPVWTAVVVGWWS